MTWLLVALSRFAALFRKRRLEEELNDELQSHLHMLIQENLRKGMLPDEARASANRRLGGLEQLKEAYRDRRSLPLVETTLLDIRYAARALAKNPGFTLVAVLTLALGIGVNTTLFTAFNAVALKPLSVKDADSVVRMERWFESGARGDSQYGFSYPEYLYFRDQGVFSSIVAASWPVRLAAVLPAEAVGAARFHDTRPTHGQLVSANYFRDLGVNAAVGRTFIPEENETPGAHPVIVLSHLFWQSRLNSDPKAVGQIVKLNNTSFTVIGIAPPDFLGTGIPPVVPDFWAPLTMLAELAPGSDWLNTSMTMKSSFLGA